MFVLEYSASKLVIGEKWFLCVCCLNWKQKQNLTKSKETFSSNISNFRISNHHYSLGRKCPEKEGWFREPLQNVSVVTVHISAYRLCPIKSDLLSYYRSWILRTSNSKIYGQIKSSTKDTNWFFMTSVRLDRKGFHCGEKPYTITSLKLHLLKATYVLYRTQRFSWLSRANVLLSVVVVCFSAHLFVCLVVA